MRGRGRQLYGLRKAACRDEIKSCARSRPTIDEIFCAATGATDWEMG